ncbi:thrombospondin type-1 domain-containing protein 7B [Pleurodeles waltl]
MLLRNEWAHVHWPWHNRSKFLLLLIILVPHAAANVEDKEENQFVWKTGPWGRCAGDCGPDGIQSRSVWCVHKDGWTTHYSHCKQTSRPDSQQSCFKVCDWHNELFEWEVSDWQMCKLVLFTHGEVKPRTSECTTAQHGLQHRKIHCMQTLNRTVVADEICEYFTPRPPIEQVCLIPCPRDCIVSEFSSWSKCNKGCGKSLQHRTRSVLSPSLYGGSKCPNLTESRLCESKQSCPAGEEIYTYSLKVGPWSECRMPHLKDINLSGRTMLDFSSDSSERGSFRQQSNKPPNHSKPWSIEIGYQTRQVRCSRSDGKNAMLSICTQGNIPLTFQSCIIAKDCEMSDWSTWSSCSKTCQSGDLSPGFRSRNRSVKQIPLAGGKECQETEEKEACYVGGEMLPPCPRFLWKTSEWKECEVSQLLDQQDSRRNKPHNLCGGGIQTRDVFCVKSTHEIGMQALKEVFRPVDQKLCAGPVPPTSQLCSIPCSADCVVSSWSAWGPCMHENCQDPLGRKGYRLRRRNAVIESTGESGVCPHLVESIFCEDPTCYQWVISGKDACVPDNGECGHGHYMVKPVCKNEKGEDVANELCSDPPPSQMVCEVPCHADCVTTEWSTWSVCSHSCSSKKAEGTQRRTRSILALLGEGGKACPTTEALQEYRPCNDHTCTSFYWEISAWGPCSEGSMVTALNATINWNGAATCGVGIQTRKAFCMKNIAGQVTNKRCPDSLRPETVRPCLLPCKKDCVVTLFSEWTSCPTTCQKDNVTSVKQSRYRIIIEHAENGGQECPDTLFEERECENFVLCPTYRWKAHKWNQCVLAPDSVRQGVLGAQEICGPGLQSRDITCLSDDNLSVDATECLQCAGPVPTIVQDCFIACKDDCTFTPWTKFTSCSSDCGSTRSRRRSLTGRSRKRDRCQNNELYPLVETEACPCQVFTSRPFGNWSECLIAEEKSRLPMGMKIHGEIKECGEGLRQKVIACYDQHERLVSPSNCISSGYIEELCVVPCPFDCKLSDWSTWSPCSASCGTGVKTRSKWLKEKPYNGGRPCPKLDLKNQVSEAVPCYSKCNQYSWAAEPWLPCKISGEEKSPHCGEGIQTRYVRCKNYTEGGAREYVDNSLCNQYEMPPETQNCTLVCPGECVMSEWGQWSACPVICDSNSTRARTRFPVRAPSHGKLCPEDTQIEACVLNENCFHYQYNITDWSTCQLSENAACGQGIKTRILDCIGSDGKSVNINFCEQRNQEKPSKMNIHCLIECAVNCQLSEWSTWSQCSRSCGVAGQTVRSRHIIMPSQGEGRPCSTQFIQYKNCPANPCYNWVLGEWSQCKVESGQCGDGYQIRNITCVVHDASFSDVTKQVEQVMCGDLPSKDTPLHMPCYVPCPGDCHLTEWSPWSACELTCIDGRSFETVGRQSRSKAFINQLLDNTEMCPEQVLEIRSCIGGKCYDYEWKMGPWRDNERAVWCQRSDGITVTGGCSSQSQPSESRQCDPPCRKPFSYCTQSGICGCETGYAEIMRSNGVLDYCMKIPGMAEKKADVKTHAGKSKPINSKVSDMFHGWSVQPFDPDGRPKMWVYGASAGVFLLIVFLICMSYILCKTPKQHQLSVPQQKPLTLAYDGDVDM